MGIKIITEVQREKDKQTFIYLNRSKNIFYY